MIEIETEVTRRYKDKYVCVTKTEGSPYEFSINATGPNTPTEMKGFVCNRELAQSLVDTLVKALE